MGRKSIIEKNLIERTPVDLIIDKEYYVSFGNHEAYRCKLVEIPNSKGHTTHLLFADEIGNTPEEAVINEVTF